MSLTETLSMTVSHDEYFALKTLKEKTSSDVTLPVRIELVHPVATREFKVDVVVRIVLGDGHEADPLAAVRKVMEDEQAEVLA